ncbi:hypothetical protein [Micromonospora sp. MH99]|uniref:hypothetical protein n=1 Tax=Micromonospora sp. MH99 TaxID=1945510 RepID=UPI001F1F6F3B|nr:hypothetical protein [Micromonospora sp. MH99]MCF0096839.1 hypothetical protein [Micromonospora sp. MH99]
MAAMLARHLPSLADRVPAREPSDEEVREAAKTEPALRDAAALRGQIPMISNNKARRILGWPPRWRRRSPTPPTA